MQGLSFPPPSLTQDNRLLWSLVGASMNIDTDQALAKAFTFTNYIIDRIVVTNASVSLTTAVGGLYTGSAKGGAAVVAADQAYSALTTATSTLALTIADSDRRSNSAFNLSLTTPQGAPATADIYVYGYVLS